MSDNTVTETIKDWAVIFRQAVCMTVHMGVRVNVQCMYKSVLACRHVSACVTLPHSDMHVSL